MVQQAQVYVGTAPSGDDWKIISTDAFLMGQRDGDHLGAALLYIQSLRYADTNKSVAHTYRGLGVELENLDLIDAGRIRHRLAVGLSPGDDLSRRFLADVLVKQKKYAEAEPMLPRAASARF